MLVKLFALGCRYGEIESIRVLHERFCAFVNFKNANMAARAMEKLNVSTSFVPLTQSCACFLQNIIVESCMYSSSHRVIVLRTHV